MRRSNQEPCRYFANGICAKGNSCTFLHDVSKRNENICHFNLAGKCSYGQSCRFLHTRPRNEVPTPSFSVPPPPLPTVVTHKVRPVQLAQPGLNTQAVEFIPSWKMKAKARPVSYASAASSSSSTEPSSSSSSHLETLFICPYYEKNGECHRKDTDCPFAHGNHCDMCNQWSLHPFSEQKKKQHQLECLELHSREMERAFMLQKTEDKTCGICMENIMEKNLRFGILNGCQHCFCLDCIRQWRSRDQESMELATKTVRSCPECRQHSDYVIPSMFWVEKGEEKTLLIQMYKENMKDKVCKYYMSESSRGDCPFGNKCFYKHQLPDGSIDPGESPHMRRRPRLCDFLFQNLDDDDDVDIPDVDWEDLLDQYLADNQREHQEIMESVQQMLAGLGVDPVPGAE